MNNQNIGQNALNVGQNVGQGVVNNAPGVGSSILSNISNFGTTGFSNISSIGNEVTQIFNNNTFASINQYFFTVLFFIGSTFANSIKQYFYKLELLELERATSSNFSILTNNQIEKIKEDNSSLLQSFRLKEFIINPHKKGSIHNKILMANIITIILKLLGIFSMPAMLLGICESTILFWNNINNIAMLKNEYNIFDISSLISYVLGFIGITSGTPIWDTQIQESSIDYFFNIYENNKGYITLFGILCICSIIFIGFIKNNKAIGGGNHIFTIMYTIACASIATIKFFLYKILDNINRNSTSMLTKIFNITFIFVIILIIASGMIIDNINTEIFENVFISFIYTPIYYLIYIVLTFFHCLVVFKTNFFTNESKTMLYFGGFGAFIVSVSIMIFNNWNRNTENNNYINEDDSYKTKY